MCVVSCDKIEPGNYTVYAGAPVVWEPGTAFDAVQRAYVEKYTGPKCSNCPLADVTLDAAHGQFGDRLAIVSINHPTGQGVQWQNSYESPCYDHDRQSTGLFARLASWCTSGQDTLTPGAPERNHAYVNG